MKYCTHNVYDLKRNKILKSSAYLIKLLCNTKLVNSQFNSNNVIHITSEFLFFTLKVFNFILSDKKSTSWQSTNYVYIARI